MGRFCKFAWITAMYSLLLLFQFTESMHSILDLPNISPREFHRGDSLQVKVKRLSSTMTQIPYDYYFLNYCKPPEIGYSVGKSREFLQVDPIKDTVYTFKMMEEQPYKVACRLKLDAAAVKNFKEKIDYQYQVNMILDNLPGAVTWEWREQEVYDRGFHVGYKTNYLGGTRETEKYLINNHLNFKVRYCEDSKSDTARIVGFLVTPYSINHKDWDEKNPQLLTRNSSGRAIIEYTTFPQEIGIDKEVVFTYDVSFEPCFFRWPHRKICILIRDDQNHWSSIINSLMILIFLSGLIARIMRRKLTSDLANYNSLEWEDKYMDETRSKLFVGDIFKPPQNSSLLCVYVGTGLQLLGITLVVLMFPSILSVNSALNLQGGQVITIVLLWVFTGLFSGYTSASLYKTLINGMGCWMRISLKTSFIFPSILFSFILVMKSLILTDNSSGAVPFETVVSLVLLWFCVSGPLIFLGSWLGFKSPAIEQPVKTYKISLDMHDKPWFLSSLCDILVGGLVPFAIFNKDLFLFFMTFIWGNQLSFISGFHLIVSIIHLVMCAEIAILWCYFQLCDEDYRWWWRACLTAGSSGLYLFFYSIYFFTFSDITKLVSCIIYFGYMLIISFAVFVLTGTMGLFACLWFVRRVCSSVKND